MPHEQRDVRGNAPGAPRRRCAHIGRSTENPSGEGDRVGTEVVERPAGQGRILDAVVVGEPLAVVGHDRTDLAERAVRDQLADHVVLGEEEGPESLLDEKAPCRGDREERVVNQEATMAAREKQKDYEAAVKAYETAADRYHNQPAIAADAMYRWAIAYQKQATKAEYDQGKAGQAIPESCRNTADVGVVADPAAVAKDDGIDRADSRRAFRYLI